MSKAWDDKARDWISSLDHEWGASDGFFAKAREGIFDRPRGEAVYELLKSIQLPDQDELDRKLERKLVSRLWMIPAFLAWQEHRVAHRRGDVQSYGVLKVRITEAIDRILNVP